MSDSGQEAIMNSIWQALSMRLTVFPKPGENIRSEGWWPDIAGQQPEQRITQPRFGKTVEVGAFEGGKLALSIEPVRIDWNYTPISDPQAESTTLSVLGPFLDTLDKFSSAMLTWLGYDSLPGVDRIAYGAVLVIPVSDRMTGYERLGVFLKDVKIDTVNSSDFLYQINRPRKSKIIIPNLTINRLSKWSVLASFLNVFQITAKQTHSHSSITNMACMLEFDINTSPDTELHSYKDRLADIFTELIDLGKEIADKGDIP